MRGLNVAETVLSKTLKVKDVMTTDVLFFSEADSIASVLETLDTRNISGAPVINAAGDYVGVVTKTDLSNANVLIHSIRNHLEQGKVSMTVHDAMSKGKPINVSQEMLLREAAAVMVEKKVHRLFAVDPQDKITGVISSLDVIKHLIKD